MKKLKNLINIVSIFFVILCINNSKVFATSDVYDVILFWGQSNMTGYCGIKPEEEKADTRYQYDNQNSVQQFSKITGIEEEILRSTPYMNWSKIKQKDNTVFEYNYTANLLKEITEESKKFGEFVKYDASSEKLIAADKEDYSLQESYGTNMISQFCQTYYEKTGRKVVVVLASNGGEKIESFLPSTDGEYLDKEEKYLFESMKEKYKAAIDYLEDNDIKIGNKLYISFQGEANVSSKTPTSKYKRIFKKVHDALKKELGIEKGAIVQTSTMIGRDGYEWVEEIHKAQEELITENEDIILGSSYAYERFVPNKEEYEKEEYKNPIYVDESGKKYEYTKAYDYASYSVCFPTQNTIHFTSAALSQIGKETAENLSIITKIEVVKNPNKLEYEEGTSKVDLSGGKIKVYYASGATQIIDMNNEKIEINDFNSSKIGKQLIKINYGGQETTFEVNITKKNIEESENPGQNQIENQNKIDDTIRKDTILPKAGKRIVMFEMLVLFIFGLYNIIRYKRQQFK